MTQVSEMVSKLGRYIGLSFDEIIFSKLTEDFGGHPFLIRQICSNIHRECKGERPAKVDKALYEKVKTKFKQAAIEYLEMIVQVLRDWYPDEYDMLCFLALGELDIFEQFARDHGRYTKHLIGYGLIQQSPNGYSFNIETVRDYLILAHKYERLNLTPDQKVAEISDRRNKIEKGLRNLTKNTLVTKYGKKKAAENVLFALPENRRNKMGAFEINLLLERDESGLFFLELVNLIMREWDAFKNVFDMDKDRLRLILNDINQTGRPDAHAKYVNEDEFTQLRLHFKKLESILKDWGAL